MGRAQRTLTFQEYGAVPRGGLVSSEPQGSAGGGGARRVLFRKRPPPRGGAAFDRCKSQERRPDTPSFCLDLAGPVLIHLTDFSGSCHQKRDSFRCWAREMEQNGTFWGEIPRANPCSRWVSGLASGRGHPWAGAPVSCWLRGLERACPRGQCGAWQATAASRTGAVLQRSHISLIRTNVGISPF